MKPIRLMMITSALGLLALGQAQGQTSTEPTKPYALRGVEVGITLAAFKAFPIPVDKGQTQTQSWCSDQSLPRDIQMWGSTPNDMGEVISCEWFSVAPGSMLGLDNHWLDLGSGQGIATFRFVNMQGDWRLFEIVIGANNQYYAGIMDALTRNYGTGKAVTKPFQTRAGQLYDNVITDWSNGVSAIHMEQRHAERDRYQLIYSHSALAKIVDARIESNRAQAAGKI